MAGPMIDVVSILRAQLRAYLEAEAASRLPSTPVVVFEDFPAPGVKLPERALSIAFPEGAEVATRYWPPEPFELTPDAPGSTSGRVQYSFGQFSIPVQLDVWTRYRDAQVELARFLGAALFRHPNETLHNDTWPRLGAWPELVLPPPEGLPGVLVFWRFPRVGLPITTGSSSQEGEFRAIVSGDVEGYLTSEEAVSILRSFTLDQGGGDASTLTTP